MELRQLKYFVKVATLEHFGKASIELNIVQPALTRQIKQLEEELGVTLFERIGRGVRLTQTGKVLLDRATHLIEESDRLIELARRAEQGKVGNLRIAFADGTTYSGHFPAIIGKFRKRNPEVEIQLVPASSVEQAELLRNEKVDVGFVYWLPPSQTNVSHTLINEERISLAVAKSNKLAKKKSVKLADLRGLPFIWFKRANSPLYYDLIVSKCTAAGVTLNVVQEAFTESTMLSLVAADIGLTFITEAAQRRKPEDVALLEIKDLKATIRLMAMWRKNDKNPALAEFVSLLKA